MLNFIRSLQFNALVVFGVMTLPAMADVSKGLELLEAGDVSAAATEFQTAFDENGDGDGAFYLGRLFEFGVGVEADLVRAANLYAAAAAANRPSELAKVRLGDFYVDGTVLLRDYSEAAKLYCEAAESGIVEAQVNCGLVHQTGQGVDKDLEKALVNFERAAEQGSVVAINLAASAYLNGVGTLIDREKARMLFEQGAELGNGLSFYELARLWAFPANPDDADDVQAYVYANLAAVRQVEDAVALRDELEARMSASDILVGQAKARAWTEERASTAQPNN